MRQKRSWHILGLKNCFTPPPLQNCCFLSHPIFPLVMGFTPAATDAVGVCVRLRAAFADKQRWAKQYIRTLYLACSLSNLSKKQGPRKAVGCFRMKESYLSPLLNAWALDKNIIKWKELLLVLRFLQGISRPMISLMGEETMMILLYERRKATISTWSEIQGVLSKDAFAEVSCCAEPRALSY